ncbi:hypothetical protein GpartN1_g5400.t1 [Galdieria partita]|uniref:Uncharacterized protein n=1 Tax=Galdieria partita TaxID=83374 RepID=A0A9C7Q0K0_9RHOD|nr:hypothetical protein GpartN1_g5400.t1 [Galdieria partita]
MSWKEENCELSALRSLLEAQAGSLSSLAVRLRTAEYNIDKQLCANKGLKSALVKLASREAVTRSQVYAALEKIETEVSDLQTGMGFTHSVVSGKTKNETQSFKKDLHVCTECQTLSRRMEAMETQLEAITRQLQLQSVIKPTSELSMKEDANGNVDQEHICSVTTEHALEPRPGKLAGKDVGNVKNDIRSVSQAESWIDGENKNVFSSDDILNALEAVSRKEDISPDEFYCQLDFYLKRIYLSTICNRTISARFIFDLGRCFLLIENSKAFKNLERDKKKQLNLLLKDVFVHFDWIFSLTKKNLDKPTKPDKVPVSAETNYSDHCSTSTFEALCAEKQNDYPLQQIFDESGFLNTEDHCNPTQKTTGRFKDKARRKESVSWFEEKENLKTIALDDSTDLEWKECFRSMNENPF